MGAKRVPASEYVFLTNTKNCWVGLEVEAVWVYSKRDEMSTESTKTSNYTMIETISG